VTGNEDQPEEHSSGSLYIVGAPIGNWEDVTLRSLRILREVDLIVAEDTRITLPFLRHYDISTPTTSYHQHSGGAKAVALADQVEAGRRIALVSDAGMPCFADPGSDLIRECLRRNLKVAPVPGPTAAVAALAGSGLSAQRFVFDGFPPRRKKNRAVFFRRLIGESRTVVLYESPRRLRETLAELRAALGDLRNAVIGRDLTKPSEGWFRGTLEEAASHYRRVAPRGEFVLMIEGSGSASAESGLSDSAESLLTLEEKGLMIE
jgi:16S rRNA (cytidine1402-2'-O)-methyltransferase